MDIIPNGTLYLINENALQYGSGHSFTFADTAEQYTYFYDRRTAYYNEYQYIRKDLYNSPAIRIGCHVDDITTSNYCMYENHGKWYYCFILDRVYVNEMTTDILIKVDVYQSFQFDHYLNPSFIERSHLDRWTKAEQAITPKFSTTPENLELGGEYQLTRRIKIPQTTEYILIVSMNSISVEPPDTTFNSNWNNIVVSQPLHYYLMPIYSSQTFSFGGQTCYTAYYLNDVAYNQDIIQISYVPYLPFDVNTDTCKVITVKGLLASSKILEIKPSQIQLKSKNIGSFNMYANDAIPPYNVFIPKIPRQVGFESKLLTHPYKYFVLNDMQGNAKVYKPQFIGSSGQVNIWVKQNISNNLKTKYYIGSSYCGETDGKTHCIINTTVNDFPLATDVYTTYLQQNKASMISGLAIGAASTVAGLAIGAATGGVGLAVSAGAVGSQIGSVVQLMARLQDMKELPDTMRNAGNNIDFSLVDQNTGVYLDEYRVAQEYKEQIWHFFQMFGYKVCRVESPSLKSRWYYNYIKTVGANVIASIPSEFTKELRELYDNGLTLWHYHPNDWQPLNYNYENVERSLM